MENTNYVTGLLESVRRESENFETVKQLAELAMANAGKRRADAIRVAMATAPVKDVAEAAGVSRQRLYRIIDGGN